MRRCAKQRTPCCLSAVCLFFEILQDPVKAAPAEPATGQQRLIHQGSRKPFRAAVKAGNDRIFSRSNQPIGKPEGSGLTFWRVFAQYAFITFQAPSPIRTALKPLGDTQLGVNRAVHHRNIGLFAIGNDLFQANLTVANERHERNEHGITIRSNNPAGIPCSLCAKRRHAQESRPRASTGSVLRMGRSSQSVKVGLAARRERGRECFGSGRRLHKDPS